MNKYAKMIIERRRDYGDDYRRGYDREDYRRRDYDRYDRDYDRYERRYDDRRYDDHHRDYGRDFSAEMDEWKRRLKNDDGSSGEHFKDEHIKRAIESQGIRVEELGGFDTFSTAVNMMYSDYCTVARKYGVDRVEFYADMAKAFLMDKDFDGSPEDKMFLYYKCIAEE